MKVSHRHDRADLNEWSVWTVIFVTVACSVTVATAAGLYWIATVFFRHT